ncbi:MAG: hypothetical protein JO291_11560 [Acidimicrobiia bacterium]|nr:hypothetical protein [Acidimicrobiia bacterium]
MGTPPAATDHRHEVPLPLSAHAVARILDARPASWISSFLRISALWAGSNRRPVSPPWFRLDATEPSADGTLTAAFRWRPHLEGLFSSFGGRFVLRSTDDGCVLLLEGTTVGGTAATNDRVLSALVESISSALLAGLASTAGSGQDVEG